MDVQSILLDTSFCIRLLNEKDPLHKNVLGFYRYFLEKDFRLKLSTISVAEYCVKGALDEIPFRNLEVLPFNILHATKAGEFAKVVFQKKDQLGLRSRLIIPNDTKLFAQAQVDYDVTHFATSDLESIKVFDVLAANNNINFNVMNIREPYSNVLGILRFD